MQTSLPLAFASHSVERLDLQDAEAWLHPHFLAPAETPALLRRLSDETPWRQDSLRFGGRAVPIPRLQAWYGDADCRYVYSGLRLQPSPWTPLLNALRERVQAATGAHFNCVLLNLYRDGRDSVAWHSDDEAELGPDPFIASLSLGATRRFQLRRRDGSARCSLDLEDGSLLVMARGLQANWRHQLPKQPGVNAPRLNLTFRLYRPRPGIAPRRMPAV